MITILHKLRHKIQLMRHKAKWRKQNPNNYTTAGTLFYPRSVIVGTGTYGKLKVFSDIEDVGLKIGNYCSIAEEVSFILGFDHSLNKISTFPFSSMILRDGHDAITKGDIVLEDDVWIGYGATILSGVHIGQGAVIAARAVVSKDVPPYAIVGGIPAEIIRYRFDENVREYLLTLDYKNLDRRLINNHNACLNTEIGSQSLEQIKELFKWFPKKYN